MLYILYFTVTLLVIYIDSVACLAVEHKFKLKVSLVSAIAWPITCLYVIYKVMEYQKDLENKNA